MVFLFQDQNQGTRNETAPRQRAEPSQPFSFIRTLTVGFGITPNLLTLPQGVRKALAGLGYVTLTAGGDFHPALRTSAARNGRPEGKYAQAQCRQQAPLASGIGMSPCLRHRAGTATWARRAPTIRGRFSPADRRQQPSAAAAIFPARPLRDRNPSASGKFQYPSFPGR